jgi:hypothetical protein
MIWMIGNRRYMVMRQPRWRNAMARTAYRHSDPVVENKRSPERKQRRQEHLRRIHPMTREQQLALIEEARAARRAAQQVAEAAEAQVLTLPPDQEWAYGNGWG